MESSTRRRSTPAIPIGHQGTDLYALILLFLQMAPIIAIALCNQSEFGAVGRDV